MPALIGTIVILSCLFGFWYYRSIRHPEFKNLESFLKQGRLAEELTVDIAELSPGAKPGKTEFGHLRKYVFNMDFDEVVALFTRALGKKGTISARETNSKSSSAYFSVKSTSGPNVTGQIYEGETGNLRDILLTFSDPKLIESPHKTTVIAGFGPYTPDAIEQMLYKVMPKQPFPKPKVPGARP